MLKNLLQNQQNLKARGIYSCTGIYFFKSAFFGFRNLGEGLCAHSSQSPSPRLRKPKKLPLIFFVLGVFIGSVTTLFAFCKDLGCISFGGPSILRGLIGSNPAFPI